MRLKDVTTEDLERVQERIRAQLACLPKRRPPLDPAEHYKGYLRGGQQARASHEWHDDHSVVRTAYDPEIERYGGAEGLRISEDLFERSSETALATIRLANSKSKKLGVALDLMEAFVVGLGLPPLEAVGWLRSYAASWSYSSEAPATDVNELRLLAEAEFFANDGRYLERLRRLREKLAKPEGGRPSLLGAWSGEIEDVLHRYRGLEERGVLQTSSLGIMKSQFHMFNNRIDLSVAEECYLTWLASLVFARSHESGSPPSEDGPRAPDRAYHEYGKLSPVLMADQRPNPLTSTKRAPLLMWADQEIVRLPQPDLGARLNTPLGEVLSQRRSRFDLHGGIVTLGDVSSLLKSAGVVGLQEDEPRDAADDRPAPRTYPSAGARYPVQMMVCAASVDGVPRGLYVFDDKDHALRRVSEAPPTEALLKASPFLDPTGPQLIKAAEAPLWLFPVADLTYQRAKYKARSYRFVLMECGHMAQNVVLAATALGLASITIGGYYDDVLNSLLYVDGTNQAALYMIPVGLTTPPSAVL